MLTGLLAMAIAADARAAHPIDVGDCVSPGAVAIARHSASVFLASSAGPASISVSWNVPPGVLDPPPTCDAVPAVELEPEESFVEIFRCPPSAIPSPSQLSKRCEPVAASRIPSEPSGAAKLTVGDSGTYVAALRSADTVLSSALVTVARGEEALVALAPALPAVYGRILDGDRGVHATIRFETGATVSDGNGDYYATLNADPLDNVIEIQPCDGSDAFQHLPAESLTGTRNYDIRFPGNVIEVLVRDARSGKPVADAPVGLGLFQTFDEAREATTQDHVRSDAEGRAILRRLQPGYFARVCAVADGYWPPACAEPIELEREGRKRLELFLERRTLRRGRIITTLPIRATNVFRVTSDGEVAESLMVGPDGRFTFTADRHAPALIVAGLDFPLYALAHPDMEEGRELEIRIPAAPVRNFAVVFDTTMPRPSGWFTLTIGSITVPLNALSAHLTRRDVMSHVEEGVATPVVEVLETAPIGVLAIVGTYPPGDSVAPMFHHPQYAPIREWRPLEADNLVVFTRR
jgi:hypothetical protein